MFRRDAGARAPLGGDALTRAMVGIGMLFSAEPTVDANIEDTLLAASEEGMERDDLRVLAVLMDWLDLHAPWINADRLCRLVAAWGSPRTVAFWAAFAQRKRTDRRFSRLLPLAPEVRLDLLRVGTDFQVRRRGEEPRLQETCLRAPAGVLRHRPADVLPPSELAKRHRSYRWRVIIGPSYRADMWAALEANPGLNAAELARQTYGSFATAWQVKRDMALVSGTPAVATHLDPGRRLGQDRGSACSR